MVFDLKQQYQGRISYLQDKILEQETEIVKLQELISLLCLDKEYDCWCDSFWSVLRHPQAHLGGAILYSYTNKQMLYEVKLYVGGRVFIEEVQATNPKDARETALARNPKARVVGVNGTFR